MWDTTTAAATSNLCCSKVDGEGRSEARLSSDDRVSLSSRVVLVPQRYLASIP
jgi:hypothetical protein